MDLREKKKNWVTFAMKKKKIRKKTIKLNLNFFFYLTKNVSIRIDSFKKKIFSILATTKKIDFFRKKWLLKESTK